MSANETGSGGGLWSRVPLGVKLGFVLLCWVYAAGVLTDTITPLPSNVMAVIWFAVAGGLLVRAVRLHRQP